jgi:sorbitol/mannitol transport system permease protein
MAINPRATRRAFVGSRVEQGSRKRAVIAWIVGLLWFFPAFQLFITGFKTENAALDLPPGLIPVPEGLAGLPGTFALTLQNYADVLARGFAPFFLHSLLVVVVSAFLVVALALPAAFALVWHGHGSGHNILFFFLSTKFLPAVGVIVPIFVIARTLHVIDNPITLIVMYTGANLPIAIWMLRSFLDEIPKDVIDASRVDGASVPRELFSIAVPMIRPGLVATMFIVVIFAWNEFFFAVNLMATQGATVPMFMISFVTSEGLFYAKLAAAGTMAMLPVVILGWTAQRQLVRGLSLGAVK